MDLVTIRKEVEKDGKEVFKRMKETQQNYKVEENFDYTLII